MTQADLLAGFRAVPRAYCASCQTTHTDPITILANCPACGARFGLELRRHFAAEGTCPCPICGAFLWSSAARLRRLAGLVTACRSGRGAAYIARYNRRRGNGPGVSLPFMRVGHAPAYRRRVVP